ncbi:hypothetical protein LCFBJUUZ_CDS0091 [Staphylococcus phage PG-2021_76]
MAYEYEKNVVAEIKELGARYKAPSFYAMADEVKEVYAKAKAFDEIVDEFGHYVGTLSRWETIDYKDTKTLLEIIKENTEE